MFLIITLEQNGGKNLKAVQRCVDLGQKGHAAKYHGGHRGSGQAINQEKKQPGQWLIVGTSVT